MYKYLMLLCSGVVIAMDLTVDLQEQRSPREVVVQMSDQEHPGIEVNLDDDLNLDGHAHLIKYNYIQDLEGESYYITPERRQKHIKKVLRDFQDKQPELYRRIQTKRASARSSGGDFIGSPRVDNVPLSVGVVQQEDADAVPIDDIIEMAANGISHAVVRKDFTFLEHTITKEKTQKVVATVILALVSGGLAILSGYLGNQTTS